MTISKTGKDTSAVRVVNGTFSYVCNVLRDTGKKKGTRALVGHGLNEWVGVKMEFKVYE